MLDQTARRPLATSPAPPQAAAEEPVIGLREVLAFFRRRWLPILGGAAIGLVIGVVYLVSTPPTYKATTSLLIDTRKLAIFGTGDVFQDAAINNATVESQVQLLSSGKIAEAVVDRLKLTDDARFMNPPPGLLGSARSAMGKVFALFAPRPVGTPPSPEQIKQVAIAILGSHLDVERDGLSYAIDVTYAGRDPDQAARIANAVAAAYQDDQSGASIDAAKRVSTWLQARIEDLRRQTQAPDLTPQAKSAARGVYDDFVARAAQMQQQESVPFTDARVITEAVPPTQKSSPKTPLILAAALFVGLIGGFAAAVGRQLLDRNIRSPQQLEAATGLPCLGVLPSFNARNRVLRRAERRARKRLEATDRSFAPGAAFSMVLSAPFSRYAETLRTIKVAADRTLPAGPVHVLGVVSSLPNEGRTTVAINLARLSALAGVKVLLIDADLRNPTLSAGLVAPGTPGLVQANSGGTDITGLIWSDQETPLDFLPAGAGPGYSFGDELLNSSRINATMDLLRSRYDLIIVDLPPVVPVVDVKAAAHLFDGFVFIVENGAINDDILNEAFSDASIASKVVGTVLNKVNLSTLGRHQPSSRVVRANNKYVKNYRYID